MITEFGQDAIGQAHYVETDEGPSSIVDCSLFGSLFFPLKQNITASQEMEYISLQISTLPKHTNLAWYCCLFYILKFGGLFIDEGEDLKKVYEIGREENYVGQESWTNSTTFHHLDCKLRCGVDKS